MFILAEWNLKTETLIIYFENNQQARILKTLPFAPNLAAKAKVA